MVNGIQNVLVVVVVCCAPLYWLLRGVQTSVIFVCTSIEYTRSSLCEVSGIHEVEFMIMMSFDF